MDNEDSNEIVSEVIDILGSASRNINVMPDMTKSQITNCIKKLETINGSSDDDPGA